MRRDRIDLWWFSLGNGFRSERSALELLDVSERIRFRQFACPDKARFFVFRRAVRRVVLGSYFGVRPGQLKIEGSAGAKPRLIHPFADLKFSTSHSGNSGVIAVVSDIPVGVDVEVIRPIDTAVFSERVLSPAERIEYQRSIPEDRLTMIYRAWTAKEALIKGMGLGLDFAVLRQIRLSLNSNPERWQAAALGGTVAGQGHWHVCGRALPAPFPQPAIVGIAAPSPHPVELIAAEDLMSQHSLC